MEKSKLKRCWLASLLAVLCVTALWRATFWIPQPIFAQEAARPEVESPVADQPPIAITPAVAGKSEAVPPVAVEAANHFLLDARQTELVMKLAEERTFRTVENILRVGGFDPTVIQVTAQSPNTIAVKAAKPGTTTFVVTDKSGGNFAVTIRVDPASHELQELLNWLYPDARVMVIRVREAVLLRGVVTDAEHIRQVLEIAEQFFPKVLNQLKVAEKSERSAKPAASKTMPAGVKAAKQKGEELQTLVDRLYPTAKVEVFTAQEALILRGSVSELEHHRQVEELAEQFFSKVLNYLNVTSRDGVTRTRTELFAAALKERFPQSQLQTIRPNERLVVVIPSSMSELDQSKISNLGREFSVGLDLEVDDAPRDSVVPKNETFSVPVAKLATPSEKTLAPKASASTVEQELRSLHDDVRELRQDLRRLMEKLEKRVLENDAGNQK